MSALKTKRIETKTTKLILTQFALQELLYYTLINAVKADNVQRVNQLSKTKSVLELPLKTLPFTMTAYSPVGRARQRLTAKARLIRKLFSWKKAHCAAFSTIIMRLNKTSKASTGNAARAGYLSTPSIGATNFHIVPGGIAADQLMGEVDDGLLIYYLQGAHSSNPVSGEFSVVATPAWKIRKGEVVHCSRGVMLAGNIFEVLKNRKKTLNS